MELRPGPRKCPAQHSESDEPESLGERTGRGGWQDYHAQPAAYARKVRHETLRIAVIERMEKILKIVPARQATPEPTEDAEIVHEPSIAGLKPLGVTMG
jgi:hypothetical protein